MEPRSIFITCPEHGRGCVAVLHLQPGVRHMKAPGWTDVWQQRYPGMGIVAIEHVRATVPEPEPEPEEPVIVDTDLTPPRKRWWRK